MGDQRARGLDDGVGARCRRDATGDANEERVIETLAHPPQRHAHRRLAHAEQSRRAADAQFIVEREGDRQQVEIERLRRHAQMLSDFSRQPDRA
jgi:hypothetical protein